VEVNYAIRLLNTMLGEDERPPVRETLILEQNIPNPFASFTTTSFTLPFIAQLTLGVYDVSGRKFETIAQVEKQKGRHTITWSAEGLKPDIYFYRLTAGIWQSVRKYIVH